MDEVIRRQEAMQRITRTAPIGRMTHRRRQAFETLIGTILSQNTNDKNSFKAFETLKRKVGIDPASLFAADVEEIKQAIRTAGLYNAKSFRIKRVAEFVQERFPTGFEEIFALPDSTVRETLTKIEGIGPKTVDVLLAFSADRDVLPVDTHVKRIARRLSLVGANEGYDQIRSALEEATPVGMRVRAHLAMLWFGRNICLARKPKCQICPESDICPSSLIKHKAKED